MRPTRVLGLGIVIGLILGLVASCVPRAERDSGYSEDLLVIPMPNQHATCFKVKGWGESLSCINDLPEKP